MVNYNQTTVTEFILLGLTDNPDLKVPLFVLFTLLYIVTLIGNIVIMAVIWISPRLQTTMYFLLSNLSFVDLCYSSVITPYMLANFLSKQGRISLSECRAQMFFFIILASTEVMLLGAMAYDRYVALCNPLLYPVIINKKVCISLVVGSYLCGLVNALMHTICTFRLTFCGPNMISHFYCDLPPILKLACSDTTLNVILVFIGAGSLSFVSLLVIFISYARIISTILRIRSSEGRHRAFSTCSSHFVCVTLFFGSAFFMYLRPSSSYSLQQDRVASLFYAVVIPMLNPLIYSVRNNEVKASLKKVLEKMFYFR